jgi:hypothetical protein
MAGAAVAIVAAVVMLVGPGRRLITVRPSSSPTAGEERRPNVPGVVELLPVPAEPALAVPEPSAQPADRIVDGRSRGREADAKHGRPLPAAAAKTDAPAVSAAPAPAAPATGDHGSAFKLPPLGL